MADTAQAPKTPQMVRKKSGIDSAKKSVKSKAPDAKSKAPVSEAPEQPEFDEHTDSGVDGLTTSNDEAEDKEEDEESSSEVLPVGSVNGKGEVVDESGSVIGKISGENASQLEGSYVDEEGDVINQDGDTIGKADLESLKKGGSEAADGAKSAAGDLKSQAGDEIGKSEKGDLESAADKSVAGGSRKPLDDVEKPSVDGSQVDGSQKPLDDVEKPSVDGSQVDGSQKPIDDVKKPDVEGSQIDGSQKPDIDAPEKSDIEGSQKPLDDVSKPDLDAEKPDVSAADKSEAIDDKLDDASTEKADLPEVEKPDVDVEGSKKSLDDAASQKPSGVQDIDASKAGSAADLDKPKLTGPYGVQDNWDITNATGVVIGKLQKDQDVTPQDLVGTSIKEIDQEGNLIAKSGSIVGKVDLISNLASEVGALELVGPFEVNEEHEIKNAAGAVVANLPEEVTLGGQSIKEIDIEGNVKNESGSIIAKAELLPEVKEAAEAAAPEDLSILKGMKVNKAGKIVDEKGNPFGVLVEGEAKKLAGKKVDAQGLIWDDSGNTIGRAELLPEKERGAAEESSPFDDFPDAILNDKGEVIYEGRVVGKVKPEDGLDVKSLEGKKIDADGDVLDKNGNRLASCERYQEPEEEAPPEEEPEDLSILDGKKVNKMGNVVDSDGKLFGRVNSGVLSKLIGRKCDAEGKIYSDSGKVIGTAELIPADERDEDGSTGPFEDFPDATVNNKGDVISDDKIVGKLSEGDPKKLAGKKVDADGEILDKVGNVLGKAERYDEPEEAEPEKIDLSILAGKKINKAGFAVDSHGIIFGKLVEGDPKRLVGRMCGKEGQVFSEGGDVVGRVELVPESEREGSKEGPFAGFEGATVNKEGKVQDATGAIIGRLIEGEAAKLYGKHVDEDGDVVDKNGNTLGKAERWEEPAEPEKKKNPLEGRKINRDGFVYDDEANAIGKLVSGEIGLCVGKEIDNDGDIVNSKGQTLGHCSLLEDIEEPEPEPEVEEEVEDPEEVEKRKQLEQDKKLAQQMAGCIQQSIDKIKPILRMISEHIDAAERQPKEDLDEQKLVDTVKPLIEEGGQILQEANGVIRGLDPDGRIASNAKAKTASREATPEEYHLADVLKDLTENVHTTIDQAKKKIAGMPHAKKELNPLWGLLAEPLGQILAAVGLLLSGVLGLVGRLLSGLGLGGLLDNLLGGLGLKGILNGLGLGMVTDSLTGKKKK